MLTGEYSKKPEEVQELLSKLRRDTIIHRGNLYKVVDSHRCLYLKPLERLFTIMAAHKAVRHGGSRKPKRIFTAIISGKP